MRADRRARPPGWFARSSIPERLDGETLGLADSRVQNGSLAASCSPCRRRSARHAGNDRSLRRGVDGAVATEPNTRTSLPPAWSMSARTSVACRRSCSASGEPAAVCGTAPIPEDPPGRCPAGVWSSDAVGHTDPPPGIGARPGSRRDTSGWLRSIRAAICSSVRPAVLPGERRAPTRPGEANCLVAAPPKRALPRQLHGKRSPARRRGLGPPSGTRQRVRGRHRCRSALPRPRTGGAERARSVIDLVFDMGTPMGLMELGALERRLSELLGANVDLIPASALRPDLCDRVLAEAVPL